jgi:hypothetical protein
VSEYCQDSTLKDIIAAGLLPSEIGKEKGTGYIFAFPKAFDHMELPELEHQTGYPYLFLENTNVYAMLTWGKKRRRVMIRSNLHSNYKYALKDVYDLASRIPLDEIGHLGNEIQRRLKQGIAITKPMLFNTVEIGTPKFVASACVNGQCLSSEEHINTASAVEDLANKINSLPESTKDKCVKPGLIPHWSKEIEKNKLYELSMGKAKQVASYKGSHLFRSIYIELTNEPISDRKARAILLLGNRRNGLTIKSDVFESYDKAITHAFALLKELPDGSLTNIDHELIKIIPRTVGIRNIEFTLNSGINRPVVFCTTIYRGEKYISKASKNKIAAAQSLASLFNHKNLPVAHEAKSNAKHTSALQLLKGLNARWKREYSWLLSRSSLSNDMSERKRKVGLFLAVTDPLRKYELSPEMVPYLMQQVEGELIAHYQRLTSSGRKSILADYLLRATSSGELCPGDIVSLGSKFRDRALMNGDSPEEIEEELIRFGFVRPRREDGNITLSNRGITLIENEIQKPLNINSVGRSIPKELLVCLSKMNSSL